jgi:hypothetical protein
MKLPKHYQQLNHSVHLNRNVETVLLKWIKH